MAVLKLNSSGVARLGCSGLRQPVARAQRQVQTNAVKNPALQKVLDLCTPCERGVATSADAKSAILDAVQELKASSGDTPKVTTGKELSATWKLIWTTEQETLFILEKAGLFGTKAGEVYQVIDVDELTLQNVITFPPDGAFLVNSGISIAGDKRVDFKFNEAALKVNGNKIPFPPFGQGWFDTVYMDEDIRVAEDVRGDTLIVQRDGPPRKFT